MNKTKQPQKPAQPAQPEPTEAVAPHRCGWATTNALARYHDEEWGVPSRDDQHLFEMLILEGAQAGLSWSTILNKREGYRALFKDFDLDRVAAFTEDDVARLLLDARIVRNRAKVTSAVANARAVQRIQAEHGSLANFIWSFVNNASIDNPRDSYTQAPASNEISDAMSRALKKYGCQFVGTTICYAFMQATGLVNDHEASCFCRTKEPSAGVKQKSAAHKKN
ncbi:DNA-3-methyladenine glycosylase I [Caballeronia sp.]|uniref:DNA-3-methyladenine glycosylase I n=1 Tax=Caballeronia sp. TaxID=1931223 RepID=UPI003C3F997C